MQVPESRSSGAIRSEGAAAVEQSVSDAGGRGTYAGSYGSWDGVREAARTGVGAFMYKLSYLNKGEWVEHSFAPVFSFEATQSGGGRVVTCAPGGDPLIFQRLLGVLEPTYI